MSPIPKTTPLLSRLFVGFRGGVSSGTSLYQMRLSLLTLSVPAKESNTVIALAREFLGFRRKLNTCLLPSDGVSHHHLQQTVVPSGSISHHYLQKMVVPSDGILLSAANF